MSFDLAEYGFTQTEFSAAAELLSNEKQEEAGRQATIPARIPGRIIESRRELFKVVCEKGEVNAELKGSFYHSLPEGEYPVTGDFVLIQYNSQGSSLITAMLPRRSKFSRADFSGHAASYAKNIKEQVVAVNFDYVFILTSLNLDLNINRLARYLTASKLSGGFPVFILTKTDLCDDPHAKTADVQKIARELPVISVSSKTGYGIETLNPFLEKGKTIVFLGSSGVGKSSLLNRLAGEELMEVKSIREDDSKGRHTTTHRQLFRLPSGALIIDTPGMRELGLWDATEGISAVFAEVEELFSQCRFSDCTHQTEPGCAVLAALEDGRLSPDQWKNYKKQQKETSFVENHSAYLRQKQQFHKSLAKWSKARKQEQ